MLSYCPMMKRIALGLGGAAIGAVLGWTVSIFLRWPPAVAIVAVLFAILAVWAHRPRGAA